MHCGLNDVRKAGRQRMNFRGRFRIVLDMGLQKSGRMLGGLLAYIFLLVLSGVLLFSMGTEYFYRLSLSEGLSVDVDRLCHMWLSGFEFEYEREVQVTKQIAELPEVDTFGDVEEYSISAQWTQPLVEFQMQYGHRCEYGFECYLMSEGIFSMANIALEEGSAPKTDVESDVIPIYLGYELRSFYSVGDVIEQPWGKNDTRRYCVAGILEKGSRMFDVLAYSGNYDSCNGNVSLDHMALVIEPLSSANYYFTAANGVGVTKAMQAVVEVVEDYGGEATIHSIDGLIDSEMRKSARMVEQLWSIVLLLGLTSVFLVLLTQLVQLYTRSEEFGIWYACGATKRDMEWVLVIQNMVRFIMSEVLAAFLLYIGLTVWTNANLMTEYEGELLYVKVLLPGILIIGAVLTVVASVIPVLTLHRKTPVEMLDGNR